MTIDIESEDQGDLELEDEDAENVIGGSTTKASKTLGPTAGAQTGPSSEEAPDLCLEGH